MPSARPAHAATPHGIPRRSGRTRGRRGPPSIAIPPARPRNCRASGTHSGRRPPCGRARVVRSTGTAPCGPGAAGHAPAGRSARRAPLRGSRAKQLCHTHQSPACCHGGGTRPLGTACGLAAGARRAGRAPGDRTPPRPGRAGLAAGPAGPPGHPAPPRLAHGEPRRAAGGRHCPRGRSCRSRPRSRLLAGAGHRINGRPQPARVRMHIHLRRRHRGMPEQVATTSMPHPASAALLPNACRS